ncbi:MAG: FAD-dependent oxidoreductase [Thermodesulfobacteriota bacterium]|nr:FAD-dependent oxidoreductase [Thermodesulfobacteriota bacterium]
MPQHIVIIGAVALGPKAASRFKRLEPGSKVTMVDQKSIISYGGCGIPYFVSGDVSDPEQLQSTSFNMLRDVKFFKNVKDVDVLTDTEAIAIDRALKTVRIRNVITGQEETLAYDKLVIATGSRPRQIPIPGSDLAGVFAVSDLSEAISIKKRLSAGEVEKAVVIGGGPIGLEMAESLADLWGIETSVIEITDQIMPGIVSPNLSKMAQHHMEEKDVSFYLREKVIQIHGHERVEKVITDKRSLEADMVIMAAGVEPHSKLAKNAGLEVSAKGGIIVNKRLQTSDPDIFAGGDCVEIPNLITGKPGYYPLGGLANRQGRVIGTNLAGGHAEFEGVVGSFVVKLFDISVASAGLTLETAKKNGFEAVSAFVVQFDRAHFFPEKDLIYLELIVEKHTGRVLGIQGLGNQGEGMFARVSAVASILKYRPTTSEISNLELPYSPPFSSAMDIINALGNVAENILEGRTRVIEAEEFATLWNNREDNESFFLDCRARQNAEPLLEKYPDHWKNIPQDELRKRLDEVPGNKRIVLICNTGARSYEAQVTLDQSGIKDSYSLQGGAAGLKKFGLPI